MIVIIYTNELKSRFLPLLASIPFYPRQFTIKRSLITVHRSIAEDLEKGIEPHAALERLETKVENLS